MHSILPGAVARGCWIISKEIYDRVAPLTFKVAPLTNRIEELQIKGTSKNTSRIKDQRIFSNYFLFTFAHIQPQCDSLFNRGGGR
jgi:hypothetical protein